MTSVTIVIWISLLHMCSFTIEGAINDKFALFYGETQTGKSSLINAIFDKKVAEVGDGIGISVTEYPTVYNKPFTKDLNNGIPNDFTLHMMDVPGILDNRGIYTDADILNTILFALSQINNIKQIDIIFMTESLSADAIQLTRNLGKIREIFGPSVMDSIVVLGTKPLVSISQYGPVRAQSVPKLCHELNLKYMAYESNKGYDYDHQLKSLMDFILSENKAKPYKMNKVEKIRQKLESRAKELMANTPKRLEIHDVPKQVIKYKDVPRQETFLDKEWGVIGRGKGDRRYMFFGPRKKYDIYGWKPVEKVRTVMVKELYEVTEMVPTKIEIDHNLETFKKMAGEEWRESLKLKVEFQNDFLSQCERGYC